MLKDTKSEGDREEMYFREQQSQLNKLKLWDLPAAAGLHARVSFCTNSYSCVTLGVFAEYRKISQYHATALFMRQYLL